jgi:hypothetical protein
MHSPYLPPVNCIWIHSNVSAWRRNSKLTLALERNIIYEELKIGREFVRRFFPPRNGFCGIAVQTPMHGVVFHS